MVDAQTIGVLVTATSVTVAAIYIMNLRETRKTRKMQFLQQNLTSLGVEGYKQYVTLMNMEWRDYDDFERKYGSDNNPEAYSLRLANWSYYNNLGYLVSEGLIDPDTLLDLQGEGTIWMWMKWESIIKEIRVRYGQLELVKWFDYLVERLVEVSRRRGVNVELPKTFMRYTESAPSSPQ
ncbi:MAG: hypothetical protein ABSA11_16400 [Candidatus Bathyarchaeia archaeon]|jgi:hypothetical protein